MPDAFDDHLLGLDQAGVRALLEVRPDLWSPPPWSREDLLRRVRHPRDERRAYGALTLRQLVALRYVREARPVVGCDGLPPQVAAELPALTRSALTYVGSGNRLHTPVEQRVWLGLLEGLPLDAELADPPEPAVLSGIRPAAGMRVLEVADLLARVLETVERTPPAQLSTGGLGIRDLKAMAKGLGIAVEDVAFVIEVAWAAELIDLGTGGVWRPTKAYDSWLALDAPGRWAVVVQHWVSVQRAPSASGRPDHKGKAQAALTAATSDRQSAVLRRGIVGLLAELPPGSLVDEHWLNQVVWSRWPLAFSVPVTLLVAEQHREFTALGLLVQGATSPLLASVLAGDLAAEARACLPEVVDHVVLQNDGTAVVPGPPSAALATVLSLLGDVESRGAAVVVRLSETSLRRAFDAGWDAERLLTWLTEHSTTPVPQTLAYTVRDLDRRFGELRVGSALSYVRCLDEAVAERVLAERKVRELGVEQIAPTVLVSPASPEVLLRLLRTLGFSPAGDGALAGGTPLRARRSPRHPYQEPSAPDLDALAQRLLSPAPAPAWFDSVAIDSWLDEGLLDDEADDQPDDEVEELDDEQALELLRRARDAKSLIHVSWFEQGRVRTEPVRVLGIKGEMLTMLVKGRPTLVPLAAMVGFDDA